MNQTEQRPSQVTATLAGEADLGDVLALENRFLDAVEELPLNREQWERLAEAIRQRKISFFLARLEGQTVGICSVSPCFSTFDCRPSGVFDDFYVEPAFRHQSVARVLVEATRGWCVSRGMASLTVGCSPGDVGMYRALGFETNLGTMLAQNLI